ncbi:hypothetical protein CRUP_000632 [Coryphaenoides rupestris]|nr:hypothetical protein CRUP_000632 [Coryphaenoides rupestris]
MYECKMRTSIKLLLATSVVLIAVYWNAPTFDPESLKEARVLVTGASTGIGEQVAYHYARFGAQIVITATREHVLRKVAEECLRLGAQKALYVEADMSGETDPDRVVSFALDQLGGLDHVILNHIGPSPFSMWAGDLDHVKWIMKVNFFSYVQMAWKALPALEQSKGSLMPSPFVAPYSSTKFALNGFFGALQHELAMKRSNVSVSICTLGLIDTESAMEKVNMPAYPATDAALSIIVAGATRQPEVYYPWFISVLAIVKDWLPSVTNYAIRNTYKFEAEA